MTNVPSDLSSLALDAGLSSACMPGFPGGKEDPAELAPGPNIMPLPSTLFSDPGRHEYRLVVEGGRLVDLWAVEGSPGHPAPAAQVDMDSPLLGRTEVAKLLGCHMDTISRRRKRLEAGGLVGKRLIGRSIRLRREDVLAYVEREGLTGKRRPGRPRTFR